MNKGFTLVELLAVIVIITLITVVAVPNAFTFQRNMTNRMFCSKVKSVETAGRQYGNDIYNTLDTKPDKLSSIKCPDSYDRCVKVSVGLLINKKYLKAESTEGVLGFYDPRNFTNMATENEVIVYINKRRVYAKFIFSKEKDLSLCFDSSETDQTIDLYYIDGTKAVAGETVPQIYKRQNGVDVKWN